ncbi:hypothetical protein MRX96_025630 [Rhipicephalus microplus]
MVALDIPLVPAIIPFTAFLFVRFGERIVPYQSEHIQKEYDYIIGHRPTSRNAAIGRASQKDGGAKSLSSSDTPADSSLPPYLAPPRERETTTKIGVLLIGLAPFGVTQ